MTHSSFGPSIQPERAEESISWRRLVRQVAEEKALAEAQSAWQVDDGQPIPFHYRWEHVQAVVGLALELAGKTGADPAIVEAAAWLHDICKTQPGHALAGARDALTILAGSDFPSHKVAGVVHAIQHHAGLFRNPGAEPLQPLETAVMWDADKLSKLGVQALAFTLSAPYLQGQNLTERRRDVTEFIQTVLSRTVKSMNTEPARMVAERRYQAMQAALEAWTWEEAEQTIKEGFF